MRMSLTPKAHNYFRGLLSSRVSHSALSCVAVTRVTFDTDVPVAAFWSAVHDPKAEEATA